ncbi:LPS assembly lipoprotein LptE [Methylacidimicrobium tartarophylax]|nr:LPS assembly lipoprotein LptE [Methylacidimicrobium tartarophylax]
MRAGSKARGSGRAWLLLLLLLPILTGCSGGYRLGAIGGKQMHGLRTIWIPTVRNKTIIPQLQSMVTNEIISAFDNDGSLRTVGPGEADAELDVTLTDFTRIPIRPELLDPLTTAEYRFVLIGSATLMNRKLGRNTINGVGVSGSSFFFTQINMPEAQRQVMPWVAQDFAKRVVTLVTEGW